MILAWPDTPGLLWQVFAKMRLYFVVDDSVGDNNPQATMSLTSCLSAAVL
jgi:hypothetical protein